MDDEFVTATTKSKVYDEVTAAGSTIVGMDSVNHAVHHRWSDLPSEQITDAIRRTYLTGDRVTVARFELKRGGVVPRHSHENEQVSCVLTGALKFVLPSGDVLVQAGEVLQIPGGIDHEVEVLEDTVVIDIFSPVRRDWLDKTDTYFQRPQQSR